MNFFDTLSKKSIKLKVKNNTINVYVCGPTVYDSCHLGHGRLLIVFDILYRLLLHNFPNVKILFYSNITDIDDKIVDKAFKNNVSSEYIANKYTMEYLQIRELLNIKSITYMPKVTDNLNEIYEYIQDLIKNNKAYVANGSVYFDMTQYENFDAVFNKQTESHDNILQEKRYWKDFALWKKFDNYGYNSPWSYGRPGWHIECSAMIYKYCGHTIDIHGGGSDLSFPHHTNEILQCHGRFGVPLSNIWLHNGMICVNSIKMSKSLSNFQYLDEFIHTKYDADLFRYLIILYSYDANINFSDDIWKQTQVTFNSIRQYYFMHIYQKVNKINQNLQFEFDLPQIIQQLHINMNENNYINVYTILNLCGFYMEPNTNLTTNDIETQIQLRTQAKKEKNFILSDEIRSNLFKNNIQLIDSINNISWYYL